MKLPLLPENGSSCAFIALVGYLIRIYVTVANECQDAELLHEVLTHGTNWTAICKFHQPRRPTLALKNRYSTLRLKHDNQRQSKQPSDGNAGSNSPATAAATKTKASCRSVIQASGAKSAWNQRTDLVRFEDDDDDDDEDDDEDEDEEMAGTEDVYDTDYLQQQNTTASGVGSGPTHKRDSFHKSNPSTSHGIAEQGLENRHTASGDALPGSLHFRTVSEPTNPMDLGGTGDMSCQLPPFNLSQTMSCALDSPSAAFLNGDQQQDAGNDSMIHSNYGEKPRGPQASL